MPKGLIPLLTVVMVRGVSSVPCAMVALASGLTRTSRHLRCQSVLQVRVTIPGTGNYGSRRRRTSLTPGGRTKTVVCSGVKLNLHARLRSVTCCGCTWMTISMDAWMKARLKMPRCTFWQVLMTWSRRVKSISGNSWSSTLIPREPVNNSPSGPATNFSTLMVGNVLVVFMVNRSPRWVTNLTKKFR